MGLATDWYEGKRWLKMLTCRSSSEMNFNRRVVYSYLAYKSRYGVASAVMDIAEGTRLDRRTIKAGIKALEGMALAEADPSKKCWRALDPDPVDPFKEIPDHPAELLYDRLYYLHLLLPYPHSGLSLRDAALYSLYLSTNLHDAQLRVKPMTTKTMGKMLGLSHQTVAASEKKLFDKKLLRVDASEVYLVEPEQEQLDLFIDQILEDRVKAKTKATSDGILSQRPAWKEWSRNLFGHLVDEGASVDDAALVIDLVTEANLNLDIYYRLKREALERHNWLVQQRKRRRGSHYVNTLYKMLREWTADNVKLVDGSYVNRDNFDRDMSCPTQFPTLEAFAKAAYDHNQRVLKK